MSAIVLVIVAGIIFFVGLLMIGRGAATDEFHRIGLKHAAVELRTAFSRLNADATHSGQDQWRTEHAIVRIRLKELYEAMEAVQYAVDSENPKVDSFFVQHTEHMDLLTGLGAALRALKVAQPPYMTTAQLAERLSAYEENAADLVADVALFTNEVDQRFQRETGELYIIFGAAIVLLGGIMMGTVGLLLSQNRKLARASHEATMMADELAGSAAKVQAEARQRQQTEAVFRESIESMVDGFVVFDRDDRLLVCNEAYKRIYAKAAKAIREGATFREILECGLARGQFPEAGLSEASQAAWLRQRLEDHTRKNSRIIQKTVDGRWLQIRETRSPSGYKVGIRTNITKLKAAEEALREKEAEARMLADVAARTTNYVLIGDPQFRVLWVNNAFLKATGLSLDDVVGSSLGEHLYGPDTDQSAAEKVRESLSNGKGARVELILYRLNGSKFWVDVDVRPILDVNGDLEKYIAVMTDITERRQTEDQLRDYAEDMKRFAYIASHDLQEPLRKIQTFSTMLTAAIAANDQESIEHSVDVITKSAGRGRDLVAALLGYSKLRERQIKKAPFCLRDMVETATATCTAPGIDVQKAVTVDVPDIQIVGDDQLVSIVMQNLIGNALKYRRPDVPPEIRVTLEEDAKTACFRLSVRDNGIGFDPSLTERMLQPFKRLVTRDAYEGTGIGLSIVDSIIDKHGWSLEIDSKPGHGSVFTIVIPCKAALRRPQYVA